MQRTALLVLPLLALTALAGCSDGGDQQPPCATPPCEIPPISPGKGAIVGVVLDASITPLLGATVAVVGTDLTAKSAEDGTFLFNNLEPGPYFVKVEKAGFKAAQQSVEVVADDDAPPVLKVLLESDPESLPFYETLVWTGFLECSLGFTEIPMVTSGGSALNPCYVSPNSNNVKDEELGSGVPTFVQTETVWEGVGNNLGSSLLVSLYVPSDDAAAHPDAADDYVFANGPSPLLMQANETLLREKGVGDDQPLGIRVFPGGNDQDPVTVFANQEFTVYTHVFYNYAPPEAWRFTEAGDPPVPE